MPADDMCMTPGVVLHEIGQLRQVRMTSADDMWTTYACRQHVDDMQMTYGCHPHVVRMTCRRHMSSIGEISPQILLSCHPHVICTSSA